MPGEPWLILPTYNEAANVEAIVDGCRRGACGGGPRGLQDARRRRRLPRRHRALADAMAERHDWVRVLHRTEKGGHRPGLPGRLRPRAARRGRLRDGDGLATSPTTRPTSRGCWTAVRGGADLALGSRYVPGGGVTDWGLLRRFVSEGGSTYARVVLGLKIRDLTGGFKCFRREVLEAIDFETVRSRGYAFQVELTYRAVQRASAWSRCRSRSATASMVRARCRGGSRSRRCGWCRCCAWAEPRTAGRPSGAEAGLDSYVTPCGRRCMK